jgi:tetratricopeptide (TPR) repeat protein
VFAILISLTTINVAQAFLPVGEATDRNVCATVDTPQGNLDAARSHLLRGRYEEAAEAFGELLDDKTTASTGAIGLSRCHEEQGNWDDARSVVETALKQLPDEPNLLARAAELALWRGQHDRAGELARAVLAKDPNQLVARLVSAQLADAAGDRAAATKAYEWFVRYYNDHQPKDAESLVLIGRAAVEFAGRALRGGEQSEQLNAVLNGMFDEALRAKPDYWPARLASARLFVDKHRKGDALKDLRKALQVNPNAAAVHVAVGVVALNDYDIEQGHGHADRAIEINPNLPEAHQLKADLFMAREQFAEAQVELEKARSVNPRDEETLGRLAACHLLARRAGEFAQLRDEVLAVNPRPMVFFWRLAERLGDHRRFDDAEQYFKKAIDAGDDLAGPRTGLGLLFMRIGKEDDAGATLDAAFEGDPFNARTKNMLEVLDQLKSYQTIDTEHFRIRVDEKLDGILGRYAAKYLEEVYAELTERFAFRPPDRIQIEIFNKGRGQTAHQWFSARTIGLPWIGTVGACTGKVVAMTSPAGVETPFNWARVLKHEVAHVITLQQTNFNIPHWFTEALAVQSEGYPRSQTWNQLLAERVPAGNLFNLDNLNLAFVRPKSALDWQMAYCQSELYAEYMLARFGSDSTARMLDAYREGLTTGEAVERVCKLLKSEFEAGYVEHLKKLAATLQTGPTELPMTVAELERAHQAKPDDPDLAARLANEYLRRRTYPKARELATKANQLRKAHPLGSYVLARLSMLTGETDRARELLEPALDRERPDPRVVELLADVVTRAKQYDEAKSLYELARRRFPADSKWVAGAARVALLTDDRPGLRAALEELSLLDGDDASPRKKLASMALEDEDWARAARYAWMTLHIDVADADAHVMLGDALAGQGTWPAAVDEFATAHQLKPKDDAIAIKLARAHRAAGQRDAAIEVVKAMIERDPDNAEARELLRELNNEC